MKDNTRFVEIVLKDIQLDKMKAEEELEVVINNLTIDINTRVVCIKNLLGKIIDCSNKIECWVGYITPQPK